MENQILEVNNLTVNFGLKKPILDKVSFNISSGEFVALIGLNGSGKSTLLHAIMGLAPVASGTIIKNTKKIFFIPQRSDLDTSFPVTVKELCELFGAEHYEDYLAEVGILSSLNKKVANLSGGQFQRVMVAIALSRQPELLLLDEPVSGVDLAGETSFYKLISDVRAKHSMAVVLVSHDIHLVISRADKVICLAKHICCSGKPEEIVESSDFKETFGPYLKTYSHHHDHEH